MHKKYERGYHTSLKKEQIVDFHRRFNQQSILIAIAYVAIYYLSIYILCYVFSLFSYQSLVFYVMAIGFPLLIARQLRALENLVHFGSHYSFTHRKKLNDRLVNLLCAFPVMQEVGLYREFHLKHHRSYGSEIDPCKNRFEQMSGINNSSVLLHTISIVKSLPSYFVGYYKELGSNYKLIITYLGYNTVFFVINSIVISLYFASVFLALYNISLFVILPIIRSIAEYGEHDYNASDNLVDTTFNNLTILDYLLFHPAGDTHHVVHHLFPAIPWWKQKEAHLYLLHNDISYENFANNRTRVNYKLQA